MRRILTSQALESSNLILRPYKITCLLLGLSCVIENVLRHFGCSILTLQQGKRIFIKDMSYYLVPPDGAPPSIAPSLARKERGIGTFEPHFDDVANAAKLAPGTYAIDSELRNPTVIPSDILGQFHFTFLIRHPRYSIPSYYRCSVPPLDEVTGFYKFMPSEAGYDELRRVFDYLRVVGQVGPMIASENSCVNESTSRGAKGVEICVVDADDLLDDPAGIIAAYCKSVGIEYHEDMLSWNSEEDQKQAKHTFQKWVGFHDDALNSCDLKPRKDVSKSCSHSRTNFRKGKDS